MTRLINRRSFVKNASCAAIGTTTMWNTLLNLNTMKAAASFNSSVAVSGNYKALVCVLLEGGSDSFNMLVPTTPDEYEVYQETRSNLAVPNFDCNDPDNGNNLRALGNNVDCNNTPEFGVHPMLENVQSLYNDGKLAFISNIGTMIEPVNKSNVYNGAELPLGLFSHIDQIAHWQTGVPQDRIATGWGGKMADLLQDFNANQTNISMNMSFAGSNIFQTGPSSVEYSLAGPSQNFAGGSRGFERFIWEGSEEFDNFRSMAVNNIIDRTYQDIFQKTFNNTIKIARDGDEEFSAAYANAADFNTVTFGTDELSGQFEVIAKTIRVQQALNMDRQIFFVRLGGWDNHDGYDDFAENLHYLDEALGSFQAAMAEINMEDCVTTFSLSEFGRTLTSNGNGSDHAWGGNMFVMGGAVNGGDIYGEYPSLELDGNLEIGGGVLIPTMSADEYFAEIARWFGVMNSDLSYLFPNIDRFYDTSSLDNPIGFML